jgi:hypothetical protein
MATKFDASSVRADAAQIIGVWEANPDFNMKGVTVSDFKAAESNLSKVLDDIARKEKELTALRNDRDDQAGKLNELCTRARSGIRGFYGADSTQYELAGGTRASERKKPQRKPASSPT